MLIVTSIRIDLIKIFLQVLFFHKLYPLLKLFLNLLFVMYFHLRVTYFKIIIKLNSYNYKLIIEIKVIIFECNSLNPNCHTFLSFFFLFYFCFFESSFKHIAEGFELLKVYLCFFCFIYPFIFNLLEWRINPDILYLKHIYLKLLIMFPKLTNLAKLIHFLILKLKLRLKSYLNWSYLKLLLWQQLFFI